MSVMDPLCQVVFVNDPVHVVKVAFTTGFGHQRLAMHEIRS